MQYNYYELEDQRKRVDALIDELLGYLYSMRSTGDYSYLSIDQDTYHAELCFGDRLNISLWGPGQVCPAGCDCTPDNKKFLVNFEILADGLVLKDNLGYILDKYIEMFTVHKHMVFHEFIHYDDFLHGLFKYGSSSMGDTEEEYVNNPIEFHAYLQEYLRQVEIDMVVNKWEEMNIGDRLHLKEAYFDTRKKEIKSGKSVLKHFSKEHLDELYTHAEKIFMDHLITLRGY